MHIVIRSTTQQKEELLEKGFNKADIEWIHADEKFQHTTDAFFDLCFNDASVNENDFINDVLVFAYAVNCNCSEINKKNYVRLNAWPGFLNRSVIEVACTDNHYKHQAEKILAALNWKFVWAPDDYGFIAARIIAMIVNEAYYALQENISTKKQIDIAMKLRTNYPYGPFEWSEKIGLNRIVTLLQKLSAHNNRYTIAEALVSAAHK